MKLVFVSSTFKDMQFERDALNTYVAPLIDAHLAPRGEAVYFGDLRWGVNTTELDSEESSKKVLDVCLDEIDNCKPYMIVLIGERYGWIPGADLLHAAAVSKGVDTPTDISVTQLEIEYGALLDPDYDGRILFYFRNLDKSEMSETDRRDYEAESETHRAKLDALKARIAEVYPDSIRYYDARWNGATREVEGLMSLMDVIRADLCRVFDADMDRESNIPWQRRAMNSAHRYYMEHSRHYVEIATGSSAALAGIYSDEHCLVTMVEGEQGSGKTAFVSNYYREFYENEDAKFLLVPFVMGLDGYSILGANFLKIVLYALEEAMGLPISENDYEDESVECRAAISERVRELIKEYPYPVIGVVDDCDYELYYDLWVGFYDGLPEDPARYALSEAEADTLFLVLAYSSAEKRPLMIAPNCNFSETYIMEPLEDEQKREFIKTVVKGRHKELPDVVVDSIISKGESDLPLYIKLVVDRLLLLDSEDFANIRALGDGMDNINKYMISIVDGLADDLESITAELIEEASERIDRDFVYRLMGLLAYFPVYVTEGFVKQFFEGLGWHFNALNFAITVKTLSSFITYNTKTKGYKITNRRMLKAIREKLALEGFGDTPCHVFDYISAPENSENLGKYAINIAAMLPDRDLAPRLIYEYQAAIDDNEAETKSFLTDCLDWLIRNTDRAAEIVEKLALIDPNEDFSYLISCLPVKSQLRGEPSLINGFLVDLVERMPFIEGSEENAGYNSLAMYARVRFINDLLDVDPQLCIHLWENEVNEYVSDLLLYPFAITQHYITALTVQKIARDYGLSDTYFGRADDPLYRVDLEDDGYENTILAGHIYYKTACEIKDDDEDAYGNLLVAAINSYNSFKASDEVARGRTTPDDFYTVAEAYVDTIRLLIDEEDMDNARLLVENFVRLTRQAIYFFDSRMVRMLRDMLYIIDLVYSDADDVTLLYSLASIARMISYRTKHISDLDYSVFYIAKFLRLFDMIYEIDESEIFSEMLDAAAYEVWRLADAIEGSTIRLSVLMSRFDDIVTCLGFLSQFEREEDVTDILDALNEIEIDEDDQDDSYEVFLLIRHYLCCAYGTLTNRALNALGRQLARVRKLDKDSFAVREYSDVIDYITDALSEAE